MSLGSRCNILLHAYICLSQLVKFLKGSLFSVFLLHAAVEAGASLSCLTESSISHLWFNWFCFSVFELLNRGSELG